MDELVDLSRPLLAALPAWALKGAALLLAAGIADLLLRRRPAALRHLVWGGTLAGLLAMPLLPGLLPPLEMTVELPAALASVARARTQPNAEARSAEGPAAAFTGGSSTFAQESITAFEAPAPRAEGTNAPSPTEAPTRPLAWGPPATVEPPASAVADTAHALPAA